MKIFMGKRDGMKRAFMLLIAIFLLIGCSDGDQSAGSGNKTSRTSTTNVTNAVGFQSVSPQTCQMLIENKKDMVLLDVRTPEEVMRFGTIKAAKLVPFGAIMQNQLDVAPDTPILVFCAVGGRSYFAGQVLVKHGYKEVYSLAGGIEAWAKAGYPLVH